MPSSSFRSSPFAAASVLLLTALLTFAAPVRAQMTAAPDMEGADGHDDLVALFEAWRVFQQPVVVDGVPDYSAEAMTEQHRRLADWQDALAAIDTTGWPVSEQIDWYLVWAEMNGLDFAHRVKRPWARDPAYYVWFYPSPTDVPEREGPQVHGAIELPSYGWPLSEADAAEIAGRLRLVPAVYEQARTNLTGDARDLWVTGARSIREQSEALANFADAVSGTHPDLVAAADEARRATVSFAEWLDEQAPTKTGPSGVGKDGYTWNLRNVHLLPYSWEDEVLLLRRELARSHSALRMEEHRNRDLPVQTKIDDAETYAQRFEEAVETYLRFLEEEEILAVRPFVAAALRARINRFEPADGLRGFFSEVHYRDPLVMRTHDYHWIDLARMREAPHPSPIRRVPSLYNIFDGRAEGMATGMEELMMHAGLFDDRPRTRELIWILLTQRAARGLGGLYQHGLEMTFDESTEFASKWTPRGLLPAEGSTIQHEEQFYLRQPAYGTSYVIGKLEIDKLIAEYARQRDGDFEMTEFFQAFDDAGLIPVSLIYWELTGDKSMLEEAIGAP